MLRRGSRLTDVMAEAQLHDIQGFMSINSPLSRLAWVLTERGLDGKERVEGIALTNADATAFVRRNDEPGCARTSTPYKIIAYPVPSEGR